VFLHDYNLKLGFFGVPREVDRSNAVIAPKNVSLYNAPELMKKNYEKCDVW
jgi:hypothetical protein